MKQFFVKIGTTEIRNILAVIMTLGSFAALYLIIFKPIPAENRDTVNLTVGFVIGTSVGSVCGYFFGASKKDSTTTIQTNDTTPKA